MNKIMDIIIQRLNERKTLQSLSPNTTWDHALEADIEALGLPGRRSDTQVIALLAGLHLRNDSLNTSHSYAQLIEHDATGAYWHGIMHRMEADYANSKYWFRNAGNHPVMDTVKQRTAEWLQSTWTPDGIPQGDIRDTLLSFRDKAAWNSSQFVDLIVLQARRGSSEATLYILEYIQHIEITALFEYTLACVTSSKN